MGAAEAQTAYPRRPLYAAWRSAFEPYTFRSTHVHVGQWEALPYVTVLLSRDGVTGSSDTEAFTTDVFRVTVSQFVQLPHFAEYVSRLHFGHFTCSLLF